MTTEVRYVEGVEDGIDFDAAYRVDGYSGVAWRLSGWGQKWVAETYIDLDEDGDEVELESDEGDWQDDRTRVVAVMIGDDRRFEFDVDAVHVIPEDDFCHGCGSTGCMAERWD